MRGKRPSALGPHSAGRNEPSGSEERVRSYVKQETALTALALSHRSPCSPTKSSSSSVSSWLATPGNQHDRDHANQAAGTTQSTCLRWRHNAASAKIVVWAMRRVSLVLIEHENAPESGRRRVL